MAVVTDGAAHAHVIYKTSVFWPKLSCKCKATYRTVKSKKFGKPNIAYRALFNVLDAKDTNKDYCLVYK